MAQKKDEGLNGNEKIEQAVCQLQQEPTQEQPGAYPDRDPAADAGKRTGRGGGGAEPGQ
mgnify:CR=1 FL=1